MTYYNAVFLGLETPPGYARPVMRFRRENGQEIGITLPQGQSLTVPVGQAVEVFCERRAWLRIYYQGTMAVYNPDAR